MKKIDGERLRSYFGLQFYLSLVVIIEIITTVALAVLVSFLLENYHINLDISPLLWVLVLSGGIGSVCAFLLNR